METIVGNRYRLVREVGAGGMGRVFQAVDTRTGNAVAAKLLLASAEIDLEALLRFQQEGAVLAALKHPNIVQVYGTFLEEDCSCIVMEFLEGSPLSTILREESLLLARIKTIVSQVAAALAYAHGRGIVHRDIKPANVVIVGDDHVKVTDFGIARVLGAGGTLNTKTGMSVGTPLYMSPEQIEGDRIDGRADIYALGAVMYQMVTGRPPFEGDDPVSIAFKHVHRAPAPPSVGNVHVPADWERLILTMLAKDPANRIQTALALQEAVDKLSNGMSDATQVRPAVQTTIPRLEIPAAPNNISDITRVAERPRVAVVRAEEAPPSATPSSPVKTEKSGFRSRLWIPFGVIVVLCAAIAGGIVVHGLGGNSGGGTGTAAPAAATSTIAIRLKAAPVLVFGSAGSKPGKFQGPEGVAVNHSGEIFVADFGNNRMQKFDRAGTFFSARGTAGTGPGQFRGPTGVTVDRSGNVYVADSANGRIEKFSPQGTFLRAVGKTGSSAGEFRGVHGVAVNGSGAIYAADFSNNRVQVVPQSGHVIVWGRLAGGSAPGQFQGPVNLAVDARGNVYVADFFNNRVQKLSPSGRALVEFVQWGKIGNGFARPHGVAVDSHGTVYVADFANDLIQVESASGAPLYQLGGHGRAPGKFIHPDGLAVDNRDNLYVADSGNNRIQKFSR